MKHDVIRILKITFICFGLSNLFSCGAQKDNAANRGMQNLTARYNYLYNANLILSNYEAALVDDDAVNYTQILPVYLSPATPVETEPQLDKILLKAQTIIAEKSYSNYVAESYMLLGKAQFLKGNYFIAQEYFDYVINTYKSNLPVYVQALEGKARSLMQLNNLQQAKPLLDTLEAYLPLVRKNKASPLATLAQRSILQQQYAPAISYLEAAIKEGDHKNNEIRWTYILGQLYEAEKNYPQAINHFLKVQKSNAVFDLYFNANLSRIRLVGLQDGKNLDKKQQLLALIKDDKNADYQDQIYLQIAQTYAQEQDDANAEYYFQRALKASTKNKYQKGLTYLNLAELNFKRYKNYAKARTYYDSALTVLPPGQGDYEQAFKKGKNLGYLAQRLELIALQDTLQALAKLPLAERKLRIEAIFIPATAPAARNNMLQSDQGPALKASDALAVAGIFYFNNPIALNKGLSDFKKLWGNRKLEDNWRQSIRTASQTNTQNTLNSGLPLNPDANFENPDQYRAQIEAYTATLPLTPPLLAASNKKMLDAYVEISSFYARELKDTLEATLINQLVVEKFPTSIYAQEILDPTLVAKKAAAKRALDEKYNTVFNAYEKSDFQQVIALVNRIPAHQLSAQLVYLKALAIGRTQAADSLIAVFKNINQNFADDQLVTPLVKAHLTYIQQHLSEFKRRKFALASTDPNEPLWVAPTIAAAPAPLKALAIPTVTNSVSSAVAQKPFSIFSTVASGSWYFVIDVADASLTLSSSRFGIGQFNRGNYAESGLKHQITEFDNDQLIYIGNFSNFADAKEYAEAIRPQLKQLMKVPDQIYSSFIITKENFDKLNSKDLLDKYLEFYKNNY